MFISEMPFCELKIGTIVECEIMKGLISDLNDSGATIVEVTWADGSRSIGSHCLWNEAVILETPSDPS